MWGTLSLLWAPDFARGLHQLVGIALGVVVVLTVANLARSSKSPLRAIRLGWVIAFVCTLPLCAVELIVDWHMPYSVGSIVVGGSDGSMVRYAAATFGNRNTYVAFIALGFPLLLWGLSLARSLRGQSLWVTLLLLSCAIILIETSRLGLAVVALETVIWLIGFVDLRRRRTAVVAIALVMLGVFGAKHIWKGSSYVQSRLQTAVSGRDESINARIALLRHGWLLLAKSGGLGVGAAGFTPSLASARGQGGELSYGALGTEADPHNLLVEVFVGYGVIVGMSFLLWLAYCFWLFVSHRGKCHDVRIAARHGAILMVGLPLIGLMNSSFVTFPMFWAGLAVVVVIADEVWLEGRRTLGVLSARSDSKSTTTQRPLQCTGGAGRA
jgi:hypothetical protein